MRPTTQLLLLAALTLKVLATPIPMTDDEIQRRWSLGESEVCTSFCSPNAPGCYLLAWVRSFTANRAEIHAQHSHRDATPAWPMLPRSASGAYNQDDNITTDERTMALHHPRSGAGAWAPTTRQMKEWVQSWIRRHGEKGARRAVQREVLAGRMEGEEVGEREGMAPVLKPRGAWRYQFRG